MIMVVLDLDNDMKKMLSKIKYHWMRMNENELEWILISTHVYEWESITKKRKSVWNSNTFQVKRRNWILPLGVCFLKKSSWSSTCKRVCFLPTQRRKGNLADKTEKADQQILQAKKSVVNDALISPFIAARILSAKIWVQPQPVPSYVFIDFHFSRCIFFLGVWVFVK